MLAGGTGVLEKVFRVTSTWDQVRRYDAAGIARRRRRRQPAGRVGPGQPGVRGEDLRDEDNEVPGGTVGEIVCRPRRPHSMFEGYDGRPEATLEQMRNLWFHTGDLGRFDDEATSPTSTARRTP